MRRLFFIIIRLFLVFILVEVLSFSALYYLREIKKTYLGLDCQSILSSRHKDAIKRVINGELEYLAFHPCLGWSVRADGVSGIYRTNRQGIRSSRDFDFEKTKEKRRICAFGDSFVHGDDVRNEDTWQERVNQDYPDIEVLNFGVPAYGLDQAFLRYKEEGVLFHPDIVVIGFTLDDMPRHVNTFRPFFAPGTDIPLSKPRFICQNETLSLVKNPLSSLNQYRLLLSSPQKVLPELGAFDHYYRKMNCRESRPTLSCIRLVDLTFKLIFNARLKTMDASVASFWGEHSEFFIITQKIITAFHEEVVSQGAVPVIVIFPSRHDFRVFQEDQIHIYQKLHEFLRNSRFAYIDLMSHLAQKIEGEDVDQLYSSRGHLSARGQQLTEEIIVGFFEKNGWLHQ